MVCVCCLHLLILPRVRLMSIAGCGGWCWMLCLLSAVDVVLNSSVNSRQAQHFWGLAEPSLPVTALVPLSCGVGAFSTLHLWYPVAWVPWYHSHVVWVPSPLLLWYPVAWVPGYPLHPLLVISCCMGALVPSPPSTCGILLHGCSGTLSTLHLWYPVAWVPWYPLHPPPVVSCCMGALVPSPPSTCGMGDLVLSPCCLLQ